MAHNEVEEVRKAIKECFLCVLSSPLGQNDNDRRRSIVYVL
jgi:hypothetical protein